MLEIHLLYLFKYNISRFNMISVLKLDVIELRIAVNMLLSEITACYLAYVPFTLNLIWWV